MEKRYKVCFLALGLLMPTVLYNHKQQNVFSDQKSIIITSVASLDVSSPNGVMRGSGLVIELSGKNFILTANNICSLSKNDFNNFVVKTKDYKIEINDNRENIFTDEAANLCLIPMKDYFKNKFYTVHTHDNGQSIKDNRVVYLTYNHSDNVNQLTIVAGVEMAPQRTIASISNKKLYDFIPQDGDGGSPVFTYDYQLVGLVSSRFENSTMQYGGIIYLNNIKSFLKKVEGFIPSPP